MNWSMHPDAEYVPALTPPHDLPYDAYRPDPAWCTHCETAEASCDCTCCAAGHEALCDECCAIAAPCVDCAPKRSLPTEHEPAAGSPTTTPVAGSTTTPERAA